jgi:anti-sigma B factor antagonist
VDVEVARHGPSDTTVVALRGQLDIDSSAVLVDMLEELNRRSVTRVVVNLGGVTFCDSTGLSALVVAYHRATRAGGFVRLAAPGAFLMRILTIVGILDTVPVYHSTAAALRGDPAEAVTERPVVEPEVPEA